MYLKSYSMQRRVLLFSEQSEQHIDQLMTRLNNKIKMFRTNVVLSRVTNYIYLYTVPDLVFVCSEIVTIQLSVY